MSYNLNNENNLTALVLTGGGARAAYQAGVLQAISKLWRNHSESASINQYKNINSQLLGNINLSDQLINSNANPFQILIGTSAGAINAAALACGADDFSSAIRMLLATWYRLKISDVYRTDALNLLDASNRLEMLWGLTKLLIKWRKQQPQSLLDSVPLYNLLQRIVPIRRLPSLLNHGYLKALAITASSYSAGDHVTFYQTSSLAPSLQPWHRSQRRAKSVLLSHDHLMASSAIPLIFPSVLLPITDKENKKIQKEYFGDGSIRQIAPLAPAIHLGAKRIIAIACARLNEPEDAISPNAYSGYPSAAQIAGHALSSIFLDSLTVDVERLQRINRTLSYMPEKSRNDTTLRTVKLLVLAPSQRIDMIAARHAHRLPNVLRNFLTQSNFKQTSHSKTFPINMLQSSALASYLLFDSAFTRELISLGYQDTCAKSKEIINFMSWNN